MPPSNGVHGPDPHTTAPVLEYICLFTHDLRRKQKGWQDGRMKFHTFNNRIFVHDDGGNVVGDAHWREDYHPHDGDELSLDQGGVLVQVAECIARREQDLSDLVDKRIQERLERHAYAQSRPSPLTANQLPHIPPRPIRPSHLQARPHVSLESLLGPRAANHGRSLIPTESPYEIRHRNEGSPARSRPSPPPSKSGYAQNLFGQSLTLSSRPTSTATIRCQLQESTPLYPRSLPPEPPSRAPCRKDTQKEGDDHVDGDDDNRPAKRMRKEQKSGYAQALFGIPIALSAEAPGQWPALPHRVPIPRPPALPCQVSNPMPVSRERQSEVVMIESYEDGNDPVQLPHRREHLNKVLLAEDGTRDQAEPKEIHIQNANDGMVLQQKADEKYILDEKPENNMMQNGPLQDAQPTTRKLQHRQDEPRTELRIRGRKKRGLLMMSENAPAQTRYRSSPSANPPPRASEDSLAQQASQIVQDCENVESRIESHTSNRRISRLRNQNSLEQIMSGISSHGTVDECSSREDPQPAPNAQAVKRDNLQRGKDNCPSPPLGSRIRLPRENIKSISRRREDINAGAGGVTWQDRERDQSVQISPVSIPVPDGKTSRLGIGYQPFNFIEVPGISITPVGTFKLASSGRKSVRSKEVIWTPREHEQEKRCNGCPPASVSEQMDDVPEGPSATPINRNPKGNRQHEAQKDVHDEVRCKGTQPVRETQTLPSNGDLSLSQPINGTSQDLTQPPDKDPDLKPWQPLRSKKPLRFTKAPGDKTGAQKPGPVPTAISKVRPQSHAVPSTLVDVPSDEEPALRGNFSGRNMVLEFESPINDDPLEHSTFVSEPGKPPCNYTATKCQHVARSASPLSDQLAPISSLELGIETTLRTEAPKLPQPPRVSNPATKGRKAAKKSDAAGRAPMSFLPTDPVPPGPPRPSLQPYPALEDSSTRNGVLVKINPSMPRFQKAGGGPWSREANDLLGMSKPVRT